MSDSERPATAMTLLVILTLGFMVGLIVLAARM